MNSESDMKQKKKMVLNTTLLNLVSVHSFSNSPLFNNVQNLNIKNGHFSKHFSSILNTQFQFSISSSRFTKILDTPVKTNLLKITTKTPIELIYNTNADEDNFITDCLFKDITHTNSIISLELNKKTTIEKSSFINCNCATNPIIFSLISYITVSRCCFMNCISTVATIKYSSANSFFLSLCSFIDNRPAAIYANGADHAFVGLNISNSHPSEDIGQYSVVFMEQLRSLQLVDAITVIDIAKYNYFFTSAGSNNIKRIVMIKEKESRPETGLAKVLNGYLIVFDAFIKSCDMDQSEATDKSAIRFINATYNKAPDYNNKFVILETNLVIDDASIPQFRVLNTGFCVAHEFVPTPIKEYENTLFGTKYTVLQQYAIIIAVGFGVSLIVMPLIIYRTIGLVRSKAKSDRLKQPKFQKA